MHLRWCASAAMGWCGKRRRARLKPSGASSGPATLLLNEHNRSVPRILLDVGTPARLPLMRESGKRSAQCCRERATARTLGSGCLPAQIYATPEAAVTRTLGCAHARGAPGRRLQMPVHHGKDGSPPYGGMRNRLNNAQPLARPAGLGQKLWTLLRRCEQLQ